MLVLSRKIGECIRIGRSIEVKVLEISGGRVRVGVSAPSEIPIQRDEIRDKYPQPLGTWLPSAAVAELCTA
jgi:carbon storage regulator